MKYFKTILLLCTICISIALIGCVLENPEKQQVKKTLVLYSELDPKLTEELIAVFNKSQEAAKEHIFVKAVFDHQDDKFDLYLAERDRLNNLKTEGKLASLKFVGRKHIPRELRDKDNCWFGIFYDSHVFLVNHSFARQIGQENIQGWEDLEKLQEPRIAMENLSNSVSTKGFLCAFAEHFGEQEVLHYLWNLNQKIHQYGRFPFSPVRMAATGDADIAITRESFVYKYLDNSFPAYVVYPKEGTPVDLYGIGYGVKSTHDKEVRSFFRWLYESDEWQMTSQRLNTGYRFIFPRGFDEGAVNDKLLWLNHKYVSEKSQDELLNQWLSGVRFSK